MRSYLPQGCFPLALFIPPWSPHSWRLFAVFFFSVNSLRPTAFCSGVLGPLIGADLLQLRDIRRIDTSMTSIGGAGTFDSIVLSGLLATMLV